MRLGLSYVSLPTLPPAAGDAANDSAERTLPLLREILGTGNGPGQSPATLNRSLWRSHGKFIGLLWAKCATSNYRAPSHRQQLRFKGFANTLITLIRSEKSVPREKNFWAFHNPYSSNGRLSLDRRLPLRTMKFVCHLLRGRSRRQHLQNGWEVECAWGSQVEEYVNFLFRSPFESSIGSIEVSIFLWNPLKLQDSWADSGLLLKDQRQWTAFINAFAGCATHSAPIGCSGCNRHACEALSSGFWCWQIRVFSYPNKSTGTNSND